MPVKTLFGSILIVFFGLGCSDFSPSQNSEKLKGKKYFDLKDFFEKEKERLAERSGFVKTTFVNGGAEVKDDAIIDFEKELSIFSNSDINRPAWSDKYKVDSLFEDNQTLGGLYYQSLDETLRTKKIKINFEKDQVSSIEIENGSETAIASTSQSLIYEPKVGYSIESKQKVETINEAILKIEVKF